MSTHLFMSLAMAALLLSGIFQKIYNAHMPERTNFTVEALVGQAIIYGLPLL
jgi:hypothetical protein